MKTIRFFILEDMPDFRVALEQTINESAGCNVCGASDSVEGGFEGILESKPDALLLDIKIFGGTAFHLLQRLKDNQIPIPPFIIITGHEDFELAQQAVNDWGQQLVKILKKPVWSYWNDILPEIRAAIIARLNQSTHDEPENSISLNETRDVLYIRSNQMTHRFQISDILFLEVAGEGQTTIVMADGRQVTVRKTLNVLMNLLPEYIRRINRFNAANIHKMQYINHEDDTLILEGYSRPLSIGDPYMQDLKAMLS
ncbi:MAG: response regulator [Saprospiraceae bacterium]|uniref:Response regulator n=1 Tax=Candidatus Opimibacter skivensis TaxID=2982028 RepID=A0A9D7XQ44_9BACT|nr:response regulator [Candidatus Opimibacter skivensis]